MNPLVEARIQKLRRISRIEVCLDIAREEATKRPPDERLATLIEAAEKDLDRMRREIGLEAKRPPLARKRA